MASCKFKLVSDFIPSGDQPAAITTLTDRLFSKHKHQTLMGVTGSGKTFTMAHIIAALNRPTLILAHNKTLAAQLCAEFRTFFPDNAVEYFVSYYDYYRPEAYIPSRDVYIEKEADINAEIERLRHRATRSLFIRRDVIIVASVSCIYGLGMPEDYYKAVISFTVGNDYPRAALLTALDKVQYERNDYDLSQGKYRIKGDTIDLFPSWDEHILRLEFFGDTLDRLSLIHPLNQTPIKEMNSFDLFPATHYVVHEYQDQAFVQIKQELSERLSYLEKQGKPFEATRLKARTNYDLEMMAEMGYCKGIENYSRHLSGRTAGAPPGVLLDFFPDDFITFIDESHVTLPQIKGMYNGDQSRKQSLVDYGFRLPSAKDNRPLTFDEFITRIGPVLYVSATPGPFELEHSTQEGENNIIEQIIRPTGLVDPQVVIKPTCGQVDDLYCEITARIDKNERVLIITLTKKLSEELSDFFEKKQIKSVYLHSDIKALDRIDILHDLRIGKYDVLIGVNLLREGLDLPEVSLVAILDADKEGFLRNERSLIQTMGRAARNVNGSVILYADKTSDSMANAIRETTRRRHIQLEYNKKHGITPQTIIKKVSDIRQDRRDTLKQSLDSVTHHKKPSELPKLLSQLETDMKNAAKNLEFELAAVLRDQIEELKNMSSLISS
jgi:excinuclease ABC subunit B